jgi:hypothetical protein
MVRRIMLVCALVFVLSGCQAQRALPSIRAGMYLAAGTCSEVHVALLSVTGNICVAQWTACEFLESEQSRR